MTFMKVYWIHCALCCLCVGSIIPLTLKHSSRHLLLYFGNFLHVQFQSILLKKNLRRSQGLMAYLRYLRFVTAACSLSVPLFLLPSALIILISILSGWLFLLKGSYSLRRVSSSITPLHFDLYSLWLWMIRTLGRRTL